MILWYSRVCRHQPTLDQLTVRTDVNHDLDVRLIKHLNKMVIRLLRPIDLLAIALTQHRCDLVFGKSDNACLVHAYHMGSWR